MSRYKFEEWIKSHGDCLFWNTSDAMFAAWIAGRESMRDEAANACEKIGEAFDASWASCSAEIRKIEL